MSTLFVRGGYVRPALGGGLAFGVNSVANHRNLEGQVKGAYFASLPKELEKC